VALPISISTAARGTPSPSPSVVPRISPPGEHLQQGVGLPGGQLGQPAGVAGQQGFGLRAQAPPALLALGLIALGFLGERHELPPGREAEFPGE